jgi:hypothetical protein
MAITIETNGTIKEAEVLEIYEANHWFSSKKPEKLRRS